MRRKLDQASRVSRRYVRSRPQRTSASPLGLSSAAGLAARPTLEQLERRQMLFSLAISANDVDPNTGIGTKTAWFGYTIPYLNTSLILQPPQDPTTITEPFSDEQYGPVGSGQFLAGSGLRVLHSIAPAGDIAISGVPQTVDNQNRFMRVVQNQNGEFFAFQFWDPADNPVRQIQVRSASFNITGDGAGDNTGLLTDNVRVDLLAGTTGVARVIASFTGAALRALFQPANNLGVGTLTLVAPADSPGFNEVRFTMTSPPPVGTNAAFRITGASYTVPNPQFVPIVTSRLFGAEVVLSGPVGATATFTDLYGRDMRATLAVGVPNGAQLALIDPNDDGVPDFNDGIGAIHFTGTDSRTAFTLWGGTIEATDTPPPDSDRFEAGFAFTLADLKGLYDAFQSAGFAFAWDINNGQIRMTGLPAGPGSVIIGSPYVRNNASGGTTGSYQPQGPVPGSQNPVTTGFNNASQGLFIDDGGAMGGVYVAGILNGSSRFTNFVDSIYVGYLLGSIAVNGDLGSLVVGTDAGQWVPDPGFTFTNPNLRLDANNKTATQLVVGRTIGEISIAGRSLMDVTVIGDLNSPLTRPARDVYNYYEKEFVYGINPAVDAINVIRRTVANTAFVARQPSDLFRNIGQGFVFGPGFYRNDTLMGAEWIGSIATGVRIKGEVGGQDPLNAEDTDDVYAFAVDGTQEITIEGTNSTTGTAPYFRIVDQDGRTVAAPQATIAAGRFQTTQLRWKPTGPGAYYLIVTDPEGNEGGNENGFGFSSYTIAMTGLASTTLGAYHTGGGSGFTDINTNQGNSVVVLSGNIGALRIGTGLSDGGGGEIDPLVTYNTTQTADDSLDFQGGTFTAPGSLYNITTGSDIGNPGAFTGSPVDIRVGGDFGTLVTGLSTVVGGSVNEGDLNFFRLTVGGRIGSLDVRGGIGMDQDAADPRAPAGGAIVITSGNNGGNGDIGFIRVGFHVAGNELSISTSPGSTVGALLVSQDSYNDTSDAFQRWGVYRAGPGLFGLPVSTGLGSDVRFFDAPRVDLINGRDIFTPLGLTLPAAEFTDDAGSHVSITVSGGTGGLVRVLPIDGSQGVAIGEISVDLTGGAILHIHGSNGSGSGIVSIGHIVVTGSDAGSAIEIDGPIQVDVYRIDSAGALDHISNSTIGGDIVAADISTLNTITVKGSLGSTQLPSFGPSLIGPQLGIDGGDLNQANGGPLGIPGDSLAARFGGEIFRPATNDDFNGATAFLDDIGSPFDGQLNGLVVRNGNLTEARIDGAVGDVILQDPAGVLVSLIANADHTTALGGFDGITGNVFAFNIVDVDVGDGIVGPGTGPMALAGIVAMNDIGNIHTSKTSGAVYSGLINASNSILDSFGNPDRIDGIGNVDITNGTVIDARIASESLDNFWTSFNYDDDLDPTGNIGQVELNNTTLFRSTLNAQALTTLDINGAKGYYDASTVHMTQNIGTISVQGFRNSTLNGTASELHENVIQSARDVDRITAIQDMDDLAIDITGSVQQGISATNISRASIDVDNQLHSLSALNDIRASTITAGSAPSVTVGRNLQSDILNISGPLNITAGAGIGNASINVTGPDGRIDNITARTGITGDITASGPIGTITVTAGDMTASITTTTSRGTVGTLSASRDLNLVTDIAGSVQSLIAGRNIGALSNTNVILVRGDLGNATATNGTLYEDLRVSGSITGAVTLGGTVGKPGNDFIGQGSIISFNRISSVVITGDFDGSIISYTGGISNVTINNGSFRAGNLIAAYDGSISNVTINNGSLFGDIHADYNIQSLRVVGGSDGVFGDIGVSSAVNGQVSYDSQRNQLPPGVAANTAFQGPTISAGQNIVSIQVTNGSVYESQFFAGRAINNITISGGVLNDNLTFGQGSLFAAGDSIDNITVNNGAHSASFIAGMVSLGADGRAGGTGLDADTVKSGNIGTITVAHDLSDVTFSAGINAGPDGIYNTADDLSVFGQSKINTLNITGLITNVSAFGDQLSSSVSGNTHIVRGGTNLPNTNSQVDAGGNAGTQFTGTRTFNDINGANITINFSGPGQAFFNTANATLTLRNTTSGSNLTISSSTGTIRDFDVVTNDDASLGTVKFQTAVTGDSDFIVDGNLGSVTYGDFSGTGTAAIGGDANSATYASLAGGFFAARTVQNLRINGQFGNSNSAVLNEARVDLLSGGSITITGASSAAISVDRDLSSLTINGTIDRSAFRFGNNLNSFNAPNLSRSFLAVGDTLGSVTIGGDVFQSNIEAGADLGADVLPGGTGVNADTPSTGFINSVTISGNFRESSLTAGYLRGPDAFFGTSDDKVAPGRSTIGTVTIAGSQVGSTRNSETYRIASSGTLGQVRIGGTNFLGNIGNFGTETPLLAPISIVVNDIRVSVESRVSTAFVTFNQPMDASTINRAMSVSEVRSGGSISVRLVEGIDYTVQYIPDTNSVAVVFSTAVTDRNLPTVPGKPGPGIYRFEFDQTILRAKLAGARMDGNGDGFATPGDNFSGDTIVGDAGDKVNGEVDFIGTTGTYRVDMYPPIDLNVVMDNNVSPDGQPDPNKTFTVRGFIGDHPDNDTNFFRFSGDADLYSITLQAGQILHLGALQGSAILAGVNFFDPAGNQITPAGQNVNVVVIPSTAAGLNDQTFATTYLVKLTGTYIIAVGDASAIATPGAVPNPNPPPGGLGDYNFSVSIFDDGDSGFTGTTDGSDGTAVVNAPPPIAFAGSDATFGTVDDLPQMVIGNFTFTLNIGADGLPNTADDLVSGTDITGVDNTGIVSTQNGNGQLVSTITAAIGPAGHNGAPTIISSDVDVFHLNGHQPIAPGTRMTITVKLADLGADLGSASPTTGIDNRGSVQFGIFDTSSSSGVDDASLVFSPTEFTPTGGKPNTVIADNGSTKYGYDSNGDFYISFVAPDRQGAPGSSASFAVYIQGTNNTDYQLQVVTDPITTTPLATTRQNILIETSGGSVDWLQAGGVVSNFGTFNARALGFSGNVGGLPVNTYILNNLVGALNGLFQSTAGGSGFDVHFSTNPSDFEFQPFSTVFLTSSTDPVSPLFDPFSAFNFGLLSQQFFNTQPYGASQHSDPLNADLEDEAVVFVPSFALQGLQPSQGDVDLFVQSLTAAVGRRAGELMGLRITNPNPVGAGSTFDFAAANSVDNHPGPGRAYAIANAPRVLSSPFDSVNRTDFFLGRQNARTLLEKVLTQL